MKLTIAMVCCLFVVFAGAASAWANCKQVSFAPENYHGSQSSGHHNNDHHSDSNDNHSHDSIIHCPTLSQFLLTANFSAAKDQRVERVPDKIAVELGSQFYQHWPHGLIHGPPGCYPSSSIPSYLVLSVLRI